MTYRRKHLYEFYGKTFSLPLSCFGLPELSEGSPPDISMVEGRVPLRLEMPRASNTRWDASPGRYLFRGGPHAGRFLVEKGKNVILERNPHAEESLLASYFLSSILAAVMRQQGYLVLHASTLLLNGKGIALTGESGAGKSTTLSHLLDKGAVMVSDDLTVVSSGKDGKIEVLPGIPKLSLCEDAALRTGRNITTLQRNPLRRDKVHTPLDASFCTTNAPLHVIYELSVGATPEVRLTTLSGAAKFNTLQSAVYGPMFPDEHPAQFALFAIMAEKLDCSHLERPRSGWSLGTVVEKILDE